MLGGLALALYGVVATFQTFPSFGRVYAAYGGVFIILSVLWGWGVDKKNARLVRLSRWCHLFNWCICYVMGTKAINKSSVMK